MIEKLVEILRESWDVLRQMAPYLLFGFLAAGVLSVIIPPETVERHLGRRPGTRGLRGGFLPVLKATLFGIPLPLCSCGVIPVAASLARHGATRGATAAFLISTPQTGVDSILVTGSLLGWPLAVFRPLAALVSGLLGGLLVALGEPAAAAGAVAAETPGARSLPSVPDLRATPGSLSLSAAGACTEACCTIVIRGRPRGRLYRGLHYGFVSLPHDLGRALLAGLVVAGLLSALIPKDFFGAALGGGLVAMLAMLLIGIPIYVCATASVPIALGLVHAGVAPGAALVFLMTGPATNAATIAMLWRTLGRRATLFYLGTIAATALGAGLAFDKLFPEYGELLRRSLPEGAAHAHGAAAASPVWALVETGSAVALLGLLAWGALPRAWLRRLGLIPAVPVVPAALAAPADAAPDAPARHDVRDERIVLKLTGMHCTHCANAIRRALAEQPGVHLAEVDFEANRATVIGHGLDAAALVRVVAGLGYGAEPAGDD